MTRDDIIRMVEIACDGKQLEYFNGWGVVLDHDQLERFANLVAAAEREACAQVCENEIEKAKPVYSVTAENALKAIRARGQG